MSFDSSALSRWKTLVASVTKVQLSFPVTADEGPGLKVDWDGAEAFITAEDTTALCRGLFLLSMAVMNRFTDEETAMERRPML